MTLNVILTAAGLSVRMGCDKLLIEYKGKTLISYALELLSLIPADERILVITNDRLGKINVPNYVKICINENPQEGKSSSVRAGVDAADTAGTHYLFLNADQPRLTLDDIAPMIELARQNPDSIIYPLMDGQPCSPTIFPAAFREKLLELTGDKGGSIIRDENPQLCIAYTPDNPGRFKDIDMENDFD